MVIEREFNEKMNGREKEMICKKKKIKNKITFFFSFFDLNVKTHYRFSSLPLSLFPTIKTFRAHSQTTLHARLAPCTVVFDVSGRRARRREQLGSDRLHAERQVERPLDALLSNHPKLVLVKMWMQSGAWTRGSQAHLASFARMLGARRRTSLRSRACSGLAALSRPRSFSCRHRNSSRESHQFVLVAFRFETR